MNSTDMGYLGTVKVTIKDKKNTILHEYHNEGTITLKKAFAMFISGHASEANMYLPSLFDFRSADLDATSLSDYTTNIKKLINLQNLMYKQVVSGGESTYAAVISANLPYSQLITPISEDKKYLLVTSCSSVLASDPTADLAYITVPATDLIKFVAGTELIIEWQLKLLNTAPEVQ